MSDTIRTGLNDLIQLLTDSQLGYKEAAMRATDHRVKKALLDLAARREPSLDLLTRELLRSGGDVPEGGTLKGSLHRTWMDLRAALTTADDSAMLDECERGEDYLIHRYEAVMKSEGMNAALHNALQNEVDRVRASLALVLALKHEMLAEKS
jgi:uncharacterized protein (TIGR02284 family)